MATRAREAEPSRRRLRITNRLVLPLGVIVIVWILAAAVAVPYATTLASHAQQNYNRKVAVAKIAAAAKKAADEAKAAADAAAAAEAQQAEEDKTAVEDAGYTYAGNGVGYKFAPKSSYSCGMYPCVGVYIVAVEPCPLGVYVDASVEDSSGTSVGMANHITAGLGKDKTAAFVLEDYTNSGTNFRITDVHCMG